MHHELEHMAIEQKNLDSRLRPNLTSLLTPAPSPYCILKSYNLWEIQDAERTTTASLAAPIKLNALVRSRGMSDDLQPETTDC
jgi:hypothetical protein